MNTMRLPESERQALLAYLKKTYKYDDGHIVNRKTGRRVQGSKMRNGYLGFCIWFKGNKYCTLTQRIVWVLCNDCWPRLTIDHINGNTRDNRIENLREVSQSDNMLNWMLPWNSDNAAGVAGVEKAGLKYRTNIQGRRFTFHNPYEAFYWAIACGKRYRAS